MTQLPATLSSTQPPLASGKKKFIESIHLLRGLAAVLVLVDHTFGWIDLGWGSMLIQPIDGHGQAGVVMFFIISGFVLPYSMKSTYRLKHYLTFITKRLLRLDPVYIIALLFSAALLYIKTRIATGGEPWTPSIGQLSSHFLYLVPFTPHRWINEVFWTLGIEFQFYIIVGLLLPLIRQSLEKHSRWFCCICVVLSLLSLGFGATAADVGFTIVPYVSLFSLGVVGYGCYMKKVSKIDFFVTSTLLIILYSLNPVGDVSKGIIAATTLLLILFWSAPKLKIRMLGTISYSLYVVHYPIVTFINGNIGRTLIERGGVWSSIPWVFPISSIIVSLVAAYLLYTLVEVPAIRLSKAVKYSC